MTVSLCIRQESKRNDDSVSVEELDWSNPSWTPLLWLYMIWIIISLWFLSYTQIHCHVRIEKSPNCCYRIRFPRISLYAETLRFVLMEITKVLKPSIRRGANTFDNIVYIYIIYKYKHVHARVCIYTHNKYSTHTLCKQTFILDAINHLTALIVNKHIVWIICHYYGISNQL